MEIRFNVTGAERKKLVTAVNEILGEPMNYMGAPTFAYIVGEYTIDRNGRLTGDGSISEDANDRLIRELNQRGFIGEVADRGDSEEIEETVAEAETTDINGLTIEMPRESFSDAAIDNLEKLVMSKAALIKKALGVDELPIEVTEDKVCFPWFHPQGDAALTRTYTKFISALCSTAKEQNVSPLRKSLWRMKSTHSGVSCSGWASSARTARQTEKSCSATFQETVALKAAAAKRQIRR